jgi:transcriptional regulator with GAF, ATPase, and Fis domain
VRGAFTDAKADRIGRFEQADSGTLFLDEIGNIPISQQPKLLRVLEDGELERLGSSRTQRVDVRLISATNADLAGEVQQGRFRKDLLFRLNTVELHLPALRERAADVLPLARNYLGKFAKRYARSGLSLAPSAERALLEYSWPGNVRELSHVIERAVLMASSQQLSDADFALGGAALRGLRVEAAQSEAPRAGGGVTTAASSSTAIPAELERLTLDQAEELLVRQAMTRAGGNIQRSAEQLGLSRAALYRRLEKFGMRVPGEEHGE